MTATPRRYALIATAGKQRPPGGGPRSNTRQIAGVPLLAHTIAALNRSIVLEAIVVVLAPGDKALCGPDRIDSRVFPVYEGRAARRRRSGTAWRSSASGRQPRSVLSARRRASCIDM
jgi:2-C-methyl-D-erythritol 4-phosphate cytidylyltransferase